MTGALRRKVAIITGAGHGLGRAHALKFAMEGAEGIVVNDIGVGLLGAKKSRQSINETIELIEEIGSDAVPYFGDCSEWRSGREMVELAVKRWGRLDVVVNNAGILRDRMIFNMSEEEWDDVIRVHLKGSFCTTRHACEYWRRQFKQGSSVSGRIINTTSTAGLWGSAGQANYSAAKSAIVGFTLAASFAMKPYHVTANVVSPIAGTNPDVVIAGASVDLQTGARPEQVSSMYAFLASDRAALITGRIFLVCGTQVSRVDGFELIDGPLKVDADWTVSELERVIPAWIGSERTKSAEDIRKYLSDRMAALNRP